GVWGAGRGWRGGAPAPDRGPGRGSRAILVAKPPRLAGPAGVPAHETSRLAGPARVPAHETSRLAGPARVPAHEAGDAVVSAGWIRYVAGTEFAGLWGGSTLEAWRRKGIYRALVAARARLAYERGYRYLQVDA